MVPYSEIHPSLNEISTLCIADTQLHAIALVFHRLGTPKEPLDPEVLLLTQSLLYWEGRRAFIFFRLVPTIKLLKLFSTTIAT